MQEIKLEDLVVYLVAIEDEFSCTKSISIKSKENLKFDHILPVSKWVQILIGMYHCFVKSVTGKNQIT